MGNFCNNRNMSEEQQDAQPAPNEENKQDQNQGQENNGENQETGAGGEGDNNGENAGGQDVQEDMSNPDAMQEGGGKKKKKRRYVVKKKPKQTFDLTANIHLPPVNYNALKDTHLQSFFVNDRVRKHLRKM